MHISTPAVHGSLLALVTAVSVAAPLAAQQTLVSPIQAATNATSSTNSFPFNSNVQRRYMQLHGDLGVGPKQISEIRFRQPCGTGTGGNTRTIVLDMYVGTGRPVSAASFAIDANYTAPRTQVLTAQTVNWGPTGPQTACATGPSPFEATMALPISPSFLFVGTGNNSFVWEVGIHSISGGSAATNTYVTTNTAGTSTITGVGCGSMVHGATVYDHGGILSMNFTVTAAPASAASVLAIGATNPAISLPSLCSPLLTDMLLMLPIGMTSASGAITTSQAEQATFVLPNNFGGFAMQTQVHSIDVASTFAIPIANSNGRSTLVPAQGTNAAQVARIFNSAGGLTATSGVYFSTSTIGYGLPIQVTYQ